MKRFALSSVLISLISLGAAESRADCVSIRFILSPSQQSYEYPKSMTYDTSVGVTLAMTRRSSGSYVVDYTARLPKLIGGQPNPDFDRVYGLLLKAFSARQLSSFCVSGTVASGAILDLTSLTMTDEGAPVQVVNQPKISVCDPTLADQCAAVYSNELRTSK